jgi:peptidoglycan hydrolase-like protein with peptidoglycan-binding domain
MRMTSRRRWLTVGGWGASVVIAVALGFWAALQTTRPPTAAQEVSTPTTILVVNGTVQQDQPYGISASWQAAPAGVNQLGGTLTSLNIPSGGKVLAPGDIAYTVDLSPVVVMAGSVPAFRDLAPGAKGPDVQQLQAFLASAGYLAVHPDGAYGPSTTTAVRAWQRSLGVNVTGVVAMGRVIFVSTLPNMLAPASGTIVGQQLGPGTQVLIAGAAEPTFSFRVLPEAVAQTKRGMAVSIEAGSSTWHAQVLRLAQATDGSGDTVALLGPVSGQSSICGPTCGSVVTLGGSTVLPGDLVVVPKTSGAQVPTASILTDRQERPYVVMSNGERRYITLLASESGASIVKGVRVGERVRVSPAAPVNP